MDETKYSVTNLYGPRGETYKRGDRFAEVPQQFADLVKRLEAKDKSVTLELRAGGAVVFVERPTPITVGEGVHAKKRGVDIIELRADARQDAEVRSKGGTIWYDALVAKFAKK